LDTVLRRHVDVDLDRLSPLSQGKQDGKFPSGVDKLGSVSARRGGKVEDILLVRRMAADGSMLWMFHPSTVERIETWYANLEDRWLRDRLSEFWFQTGPRDIFYWQWLALPICVLMALALGYAMAKMTSPLVARLLPKPSPEQSVSYRLRLRGPMTGAWATGFFFLMLPFLALNFEAHEFLRGLTRASFELVVLWAVARGIDTARANALLGPWGKTHSAGASLLPLLSNLAQLALFAIGVVVLFSELGFPVTSLVAGLGISGIALALAAQKTVENLFGAISIALDQPLRVGDVVTVDGITGTVEALGIRSTRIRTADRTLVTLPNGKLAEMRVENASARDRTRFNTILPLEPNTPPDVLERLVARLNAHVRETSPAILSDTYAQLREFGPYSTDLEVNAWFETVDANKVRELRLALNLGLARIVSEEGAKLASPQFRSSSSASP
jgi:MscS family membrane protein